ncbi:MAG: hypothetical protein QNJ97_21525 [Myxococcota bacterium]|nr:hypothetical protein [Myxococcota bacterium]
MNATIASLQLDEITLTLSDPALKKKINQMKALQDLVLYAIKGISMYAHRCGQLAVTDRQIDLFTAKALNLAVLGEITDTTYASTVIEEAISIRNRAEKLYNWVCNSHFKVPETLDGPATFPFEANPDLIIPQAHLVSFEHLLRIESEINSYLESICILGAHASVGRATQLSINGEDKGAAYELMHEVLSDLASYPPTVYLTRLARELDEENQAVLEDSMSLGNQPATADFFMENAPELTITTAGFKPPRNIVDRSCMSS